MAPSFDIHRFATIDSTNTWVIEQARAGAPEGLVAVADEQTAGRGRLGRAWLAPPGASLLMSVLLRPAGLAAGRLHLATAAVAMAGADAVAAVSGVEADLKWPNDLIIGTRKLGGVLTEVDWIKGDDVPAVVVGIGINCTWPEVLPAEIADIAISASHVAGEPVDRDDVLDELLEGLAARLDDGWDSVADEYSVRCATVGHEVRVELAGESFTGIATGLTDDGALLVQVGDEHRTVVVGDVIHVR